MVVGVLHLTLYLPENHSLKGKRSVVQSLKTRVRTKFNVSICEAEDHDNWQRAVLGIVQSGNERAHVDRCLRSVVRFVESTGLAELGEESYDFENF